MKTVNTVRGPVCSDQLGNVLCHEHITFGFSGWNGDGTLGFLKEDDILDRIGPDLELAKSCGISTLVDATTCECGRLPLLMLRASEKYGINIICSTGYYSEQSSSYAYWHYRQYCGSDIEHEFYDMFLKEILDGIGNTGIKAGAIKVATSPGEITPMEAMILKAAGRAQKDTGVPVITHTEDGTMGAEQARILIENGADPQCIQIGHMCGCLDIETHKKVLSYGVFDAFDRFGLCGFAGTPDDKQRIEILLSLLDMGYEDQILLSHDHIAYEIGRPFIYKKEVKALHDSLSFGLIHQKIIPELKKAGLSEKQYCKLFQQNPSRLFG